MLTQLKPTDWKINNTTGIENFLEYPADYFSELTTLEISADINRQLYNITDGQFEKFCALLRPCNALRRVMLSADIYNTHPYRFIALGNTLAELKGVQIDLLFTTIDDVHERHDMHIEQQQQMLEDEEYSKLFSMFEKLPAVNLQALGEALSHWPIKTLFLKRKDLFPAKINPVFWRYVSLCPIESLSLEGNKLDAEGYQGLENFLAQSQKIFRGQAQTVRSIDFNCSSSMDNMLQTLQHPEEQDPDIEALCSALLSQGKNLERLHLSSDIYTVSFNDFRLLCNTVRTLKKLRDFNVDWYFVKQTSISLGILFDALEQCPELHTLHLRNLYRTEEGLVPLKDVLFISLCNRLLKLKMLTNITIPAKEKLPSALAERIFSAEVTLLRLGFSGNVTSTGGTALLDIRTSILTTTFKDSYRKYYQEGAFKYIGEYHQKNIKEEQQPNTQPILTFAYPSNTDTPPVAPLPPVTEKSDTLRVAKG